MKKSRTHLIDYTKMEIGRVTRTFKGETTGAIARCAECKRNAERSSSIPDVDEATRGRTPYVVFRHTEKWHDIAIPVLGRGRMVDSLDSHNVRVNKDNVDDLLTVRERKKYDAWATALHAFADQF